jgi:archaellum component FlaF (FlaF/FlaG flagellin family)
MGFGISIATAILAIGLILIATVNYERVSDSYELLQDARDTQHGCMLSLLDTRIDIYNTSSCSYEDRGEIADSASDIFYIKNTGTVSIDKSKLIVLVNGKIVNDAAGSGWLYPGTEFPTTTFTLDSGDVVKVVTANARSACAEVV